MSADPDYHVALDNAREKARGAKAIGTTGRGIGPAYEDKVARRGLRVGDLFDKETFAEKLKEVMEYHNFQLVNYYKAEAVDYQKVLDDTMAVADILTSMVVDVSDLLDGRVSVAISSCLKVRRVRCWISTTVLIRT